MAKTKKTIGEWAASVFGNSYKTISEKLSAEEHALFVQDATELQAQVLAQEGGDDDQSEETETEATQSEATAPKLTLEQRLDALEASLKKEQQASAQLKNELSETKTQLEAAQSTNQKLRQSVNPLADEDVATAKQETKYLTKADIEARENWKRNQQTEE